MSKFRTESENLKKLHEIVKVIELHKNQFGIDYSVSQYKDLTEKIDSLIHVELKKLEFENDNNSKLKCYETLFTTIVGLLEGIKQVV